MGKKLFNFAIGNPPFMDYSENTSDKPIYNDFMDGAFAVADKVELITPARFLFNAGKTPHAWNAKMLNDPHLKVLKYEPDAKNVFPMTDIKGGVAITYRDTSKKFGAIGVYTKYNELKDILQKVIDTSDFSSFSKYVYSPESYKFTKELYSDHPEILTMTTVFKGETTSLISKGHELDLTTNIFEKLSGIVFFDINPSKKDYISIIGRKNNQRRTMFIERKYIGKHPNLNSYKLLFPKSNSSGQFGEAFSSFIIAEPGTGHTQTFISIGCFDTKEQCQNAGKYITTKFVRAMLGVMKVTQDNKQGTWKYVPLQDFSTNKFIDWSKSIHEIDLQLYKKYKLSKSEVDFIEKNVKEME